MTRVMTVRELMKDKVVTLKPDMDMEEAINTLLKHKVSGATVVDEQNNIVGVFSEKDCLRIFANGAFNMSPGSRVADYMSRDIVTVDADVDVFTVAEIFLKNPFRRLPVVENGVMIGQISRRDVLAGSRLIWEESPVKKEWTDSKYLTDEIKAAIGDKNP
jgi:predicted transcriptional regulator